MTMYTRGREGRGTAHPFPFPYPACPRPLPLLIPYTHSLPLNHGGAQANLLVREHPHRRGKPQVVLLDHGLYRELGPAFRTGYCRLWRGLLLGDERTIREECEKMNSGPAYTLLAAMLTMRPWDDIVRYMYCRPCPSPIQALCRPLCRPLFRPLSRLCPNPLSSPDNALPTLRLLSFTSAPSPSPCSLRRPSCTTRPVSDDVGRLRNKNTKGDAVMLRGYAKKYFSHIIKLLGRYRSGCTRDRVVWLSTPF